jgi:hypothetical protein
VSRSGAPDFFEAKPDYIDDPPSRRTGDSQEVVHFAEPVGERAFFYVAIVCLDGKCFLPVTLFQSGINAATKCAKAGSGNRPLAGTSVSTSRLAGTLAAATIAARSIGERMRQRCKRLLI